MMRISVVTPSYNQGRFIERTIRSVLDQGYPELEYVICDNCSSDQTAQILNMYADRLRILREPDHGQADAVNKGICATSGELIGWLNSDDVYRPGTLITLSAYFDRHPELDVLYGDANLIDVDDNVIGRYYTEPWNPKRLAYRPHLCQPAVFFRRRVVDRFGLLDKDLHYTMDYEYWLRLARGGATFAYVPLTLACSRVHPDTKTLTHSGRLNDELNVMLKRYVNKIPDGWILTHTHAILSEQQEGGFKSPLEFALAV